MSHLNRYVLTTLLLVFSGSLLLNAQTQLVYVANQLSNNVSAYTIDAASGALMPVAGSPFAAGNGPNAVAVNIKGIFAYVANQNFPADSGSISGYTINATSGALTTVVGAPFGADGEPFGLAIDPTGKFAFVTNVFSNSVSAYTINATNGVLTPVAGSPFGTGGGEPEGVAVDPTGKFVYVPNSESNSVSAFTINATSGALTPVAGSPFATGTTPQGVMNMAFDPNGRFAYVTNQNSSNVSAYSIDATSGALTPVAGSPFAAGAGPSSVAVDPTGKFAYVTNAGSDNISAFTINATSGVLTPTTGSPFATGSEPEGVAVNPTGEFAYVTNAASDSISAFTVDVTSGALTSVAGSPFATGSTPLGIAIAVASQNNQPAANLSPGALTFTSQIIGSTSPAQSLMVTNTGTGTLTITNIVITGDFNQVSDTCTSPVAPEASCSVGITFTPTTLGARAGNLSITDNAAGSPQTVSLTGAGIANICPLYDQTRSVHSGATFPIKLELCDANGNDISSPSIVVHAAGFTATSGVSGPVDDSGNTNPDNDFRFDTTLGSAGGYIFNLSTSGLVSGTYSLQFTAGSDPAAHSVNFGVK